MNNETIKLYKKLHKLANGRRIELYHNPTAKESWAKNAVYVRSDKRDYYSPFVACGHAGTINSALRRAIKNLS